MKRCFVLIFGDVPTAKALDVCFALEKFRHVDIYKKGDISTNNAQKIIQNFLALGIILKSRKKGLSQYYRLNPKKALVDRLRAVYRTLNFKKRSQ